MLLCGHKMEHRGRTCKKESEEEKKERAMHDVGKEKLTGT